jgi:hypothetical protein
MGSLTWPLHVTKFSQLRFNYGLAFQLSLSSPARILGSWVRIPRKAWMSLCVYSVLVLSRVGNDLATG